MVIMARKLISNEQGGPLAALEAAPDQSDTHTTLGAIVVHTVALLLYREDSNIFYPLVAMLGMPGDLVVN